MTTPKVSNSRNEYHAGWIAALDHERAAAESMLDEEHTTPYDYQQHPSDKNSYTWGRIGKHNLVIASLSAGVYGTTSALTTASQMLASFPQIRFGLLVGIGAGVWSPGSDVRLGDVVVSQPVGRSGGVVQYDFKAVRANLVYERRGTLNTPPETLLRAVANIKSKHQRLPSRMEEFVEEAIKRYPMMNPDYKHQGVELDRLFAASYDHIDPEDPTCRQCDGTKIVARPRRLSTKPKIHYGLIASGNTLFKNAIDRDEVVKNLRKDGDGNCLCLEMEAAGLMNSFPCLVIRGVCDYADSHKNDRWQKYAAATAAAYTKEFLEYVPSEKTYWSSTAANILEREEKVAAFLRALYTCPYSERKDRNVKRIHGTCEWFTSHQKFRQWNDSDGLSMLWVSADPGCGKSVLARYLIDDILRKGDNRIVIYFFFKDDFLDQRTSSSAICALLRQIFLAVPSLLGDSILLQFHYDGDKLLQCFSDLWKIFITVISDPRVGEIVCLLDGLDECQNGEELIEKLGELGTTEPRESTLKFLLTSRPYDHIRREFHGLKGRVPTIHLSGEEENEVAKISQEITLVIQDRVRRISEEKQLESDEAIFLETRLTEIQNRTYLWVHLVLDVIRNTTGFVKGNMRNVLSVVPETVYDAYEKILARSKDHDKTKRLLQIIVAAAEPLTVREMSVALLMEEHEEPYEEKLEPEERFRVSVRDFCGLFVTIIDSKIYLLHQTAREFLLRDLASNRPWPIRLNKAFTWNHSLDFTGSHKLLAEICIWYLNRRDVFEGFYPYVNIQFAEPTLKRILKREESQIPKFLYFLAYSARHWTFHLRESRVQRQDKILLLALALFRQGSRKQQIWSKARARITPQGHIVQPAELPIDSGPLSLAAWHGIFALVEKLLVETNYGEWYWKAPKTLGEEFSRVKTNSRRPNLQRFKVLRLLKGKHDDINLTLRQAVEGGYPEIVQILLKYGANSTGTPTNPVLFTAIQQNQSEIVKILIQHGASVEKRNSDGQTPLIFAARYKNAETVQILLEYGAKIKEPDIYGDTPLLIAIDYGGAAICKVLLDHGAMIEKGKRTSMETPLFKAITRNHFEIVRVLIESGADVNSNVDGRTPLVAAKKNNTLVAQILMENGFQIDAKDTRGFTPIMLAAILGRIETAEILLRYGASVDEKNSEGRTALMLAVKGGHVDILSKLLIDNGADIHMKDNYGITPIVATYLKAGMDVWSQNGDQALFEKRGQEAVMRSMGFEVTDGLKEEIWKIWGDKGEGAVFYTFKMTWDKDELDEDED